MSSALEDVYGGVGGGDDDCDGGDDEWGVGKTWSQEENPDRGHSAITTIRNWHWTELMRRRSESAK